MAAENKKLNLEIEVGSSGPGIKDTNAGLEKIQQTAEKVSDTPAEVQVESSQVVEVQEKLEEVQQTAEQISTTPVTPEVEDHEIEAASEKLAALIEEQRAAGDQETVLYIDPQQAIEATEVIARLHQGLGDIESQTVTLDFDTTGLTESTKAVDESSEAWARANDVATVASGAVDATNVAVKGLSTVLKQASSAAKGSTAILKTADLATRDGTRSVKALSTALRGLFALSRVGPIIGGLTLAVGAGAAVWWSYKKRAEEASLATAASAKIASAAKDQFEGLAEEVEKTFSETTVEKAARLTSSLVQGMGSVDTAVSEVNKKLERQLELLKANQQAADEIADAEMTLELAQVDAGDGNELDKLQQKNKIRNRYSESKFSRDQATDQAAFDLNRTALRDINFAAQDRQRILSEQEARTRAAQNIETQSDPLRSRLTETVSSRFDAESVLATIERDIESQMSGAGFGANKIADLLTGNFAEFNKIPEGVKALTARREEVQAAIEQAKEVEAAAQAALNDLNAQKKNLGVGKPEDEQKRLDELKTTFTAASEVEQKQREALVKTNEELGRQIQLRTRLKQINDQTVGVQNQTAEIEARSQLPRPTVGDPMPPDLSPLEAGRQALRGQKGTTATARGAATLALEQITKGLEDGDQGGEEEALVAAIERLAEAVALTSKSEAEKISRLIDRINTRVNTVESQLKSGGATR